MIPTNVAGKYIFLDIVNYTYRRTIEAQTDIIDVLNKVVMESLQFFKIDEKNRILIPTGDGICIALLDINHPFDIHIKLALKILELLNQYNRYQKNGMRKFQVRIGINENIDNLIIDINGNKNVAGLGINDAQRIMSQADGGNIFVGRAVYDRLLQREKYMKKFQGFTVIIKHNVPLEVYQFINPSTKYLNSSISTSVNIPKYPRSNQKKVKELKFSKLIAYFIGHVIKNKEFILKHAGDAGSNHALFVLMSYLAKDSVTKSEKGKLEKHVSQLSFFLGSNLEEMFNNLKDVFFNLLLDYNYMFFEEEIYPYTGGIPSEPLKYFEKNSLCLEVTEEAIEKLKKEWPKIVSELGIK